MARIIGEECIACGACEGACPTGAIVCNDGKYEVKADECIDCASCEGGCPTGAIKEA